MFYEGLVNSRTYVSVEGGTSHTCLPRGGRPTSMSNVKMEVWSRKAVFPRSCYVVRLDGHIRMIW